MPTRVRIRETCAPGAVVKVECRDGAGKWHALWTGQDPTRELPGWLVVEVKAGVPASKVEGWNEIDAVELVGERPGR